MNLVNAVPVAIRIATALFGLAAIKVTHALLTPADFATFSLVLFALAVGSAVASPINRHFWAHNNHDVYADSVIFTWVILLVTIIAVVFTTSIWSPNASDSLFSCFLASGCYAFAKSFERFTYGQVLFDINFSSALYVSLIMAGAELAFVTLAYVAGVDSLAIRFLGPACLFCVAMVAVPTYRRYLMTLFFRMHPSKIANGAVFGSMLTRQAIVTIALSITITTAVMIDRLIVSYFPTGNERFWSDFLLVLSYTIALQTLLNASVDIARKHVFQGGEWVAGAREFSLKAFAGFAAVGMMATVSFPLLRGLDIVPDTISIWIWASLVVRSLALLVITFTTLDFVQSGNVHKAFPPLFAMVLIVVFYLWMLRLPDMTAFAATILVVGSTFLCSYSTYRFFGRIPMSSGSSGS